MVNRQAARLRSALAAFVGLMALGLASPIAHAAPPVNDSLATATTIATTPSVLAATNAEATREAGEAEHNGRPAGASVWFKWTPANGTYLLSTCDSAIDTVLAVYRGPSSSPTHGGLTQVAVNDDDGPACGGGDEGAISLTASLTAGQSYYIAVDGHRLGEGAEQGAFELHVGGPANDAFADAATISASATIVSATTAGADLESGEPANVSGSVWYRWTAPASGTTRLTTCGSAFDTKLAVYAGSGPGFGSLALQSTVGDDDAGCGNGAAVSFTATAGTAYSIQVGGATGATGSFLLHVNTPANDDFSSPTTLSGLSASALGTNVAAGREANELGTGDSSVWFSWTAPPGAGQTKLSLCSSGFDTDVSVYAFDAETSLLSAVTATTEQCGTGNSRERLTFTATAATNYRIRVAGVGTGVASAQGPIALSLDGAPPTVVIDPPLPPDTTSDATPTYLFHASEPGVTFECRFDGNSFGPCSGTGTHTPATPLAPDGAHTFQVRATDAAGNVGPAVSDSFTLDTVAPAATLNSTPAALSNDATPTITFSSADGTATFECSVDSTTTFTACTSPFSPTVGNGSHVLRVRAKDPAGNTGAAVATDPFTVDLVVPPVTIGQAPPAFTNDTTPSVEFSSTDAQATFECSVDSTTTFESCSSPFTPTVTGQGAHTIRVRALDPAGNVTAQANWASAAFVTDTVAPTTTITGQPANPSNLSFGEFSYTQSDVNAGTFECLVDGAQTGFTACASPEAQGLGNGAHTFEVRAKDLAGNVDPTPAVYNWVVDITSPTAGVTAPAAGAFVDTTSPTMTLTSSDEDADPTTLQCSMDTTTSFATCTSGTTVPGAPLSQGSHTLHVRSVDPAGNTSTIVSRQFTVDSIDPTTTITAGPANGSVGRAVDATFTFTGADTNLDSFECSLNEAVYAPCTSPLSLTSQTSADGDYTLRVRAKDKAGNLDETAETRTWTIDNVAPTVNVVDPANPFTNDTTPTVTFSSPDGGTVFECKVDNGAYGPCSGPGNAHTPVALGEGSHTFSVRATDPAGNLGLPDSTTITVDVSPPVTTITSSPAAFLASTTAQIGFGTTPVETNPTFECQLDGGAFEPCTAPSRTYTSLAQGTHTISVRAIDRAGNPDATAEARTFFVDTQEPATGFSSRPPAVSGDGSPEFIFTGTDPAPATNVTFECKLDDAASFAPCAATSIFTQPGGANLDDGSHTLEWRAVDQAGNRDSTPQVYTWTIDTVAPQTQLEAQPAPFIAVNSATVEFSSPDAGAFECALDDQDTFASCSGSVTYNGLSDGSHTIFVRARDSAQNRDPSPASVAFTVDTKTPDTTLAVVNNTARNPTNIRNPQFTLAGPDQAPGTATTLECRHDPPGPEGFTPWALCGTSKSYSNLLAGEHTVEARATDAAGNVDPTPVTHTWTIDLEAPDTTATIPPSFTNDTTPSLDFDSPDETVVDFACSIDLGAYFACTPGAALPPLAQGSHTVDIIAIDPAGNDDKSPVQVGFTVDLTAPVVAFATPLNNSATKDRTPTITGTAGQLGGDGTAVVVTVHQLSGSGQSETETLVATLNTSREGSSWSATPETDLPDNSRFRIRVTQADAAGNIGGGNTTARVFRTDNDPPETSLTSMCLGPMSGSACAGQNIPPSEFGTTGLTNSTLFGFAFSSDESGVTFQCKINQGTFGLCNNLPPQVNATNTLQIRTIDAAGNIDDTPVSYVWVIDQEAPNTTGGSWSAPNFANVAENATITEDDVTVSGIGYDPGAENPKDFSCRVGTSAGNPGAFFDCQGPSFQFSNLNDGVRRLEIAARDKAGNIDATGVVLNVRIETEAPETTLVKGPSGVLNNARVQLEFSGADENPITFRCRRSDSVEVKECKSGDFIGPFADGDFQVSVAARDSHFEDPTPVVVSFKIDTTAPETVLVEGPAGNTIATNAVFQFAATEQGAKLECKIDEQDFRECPARTEFTNIPVGTHTVVARARDAAGNVDTTPVTRTWTVDAPVVVPPPTPPTPPGDDKAKKLAEQKAAASKSLGEDVDAISFPILIDPAAVFHGLSAKDGIVEVAGATTKLFVMFCDGCTVKVTPTLRVDGVSKRVKIAKNLKATLASQSATLKPGQPLTVRVKLTAKQRAAIPKSKRTRVQLKIAFKAGAARTTTVTKTYTLRRAQTTSKTIKTR